MKIVSISEGHWEIAPEKYPGSILPKERKAKRHGVLVYPDDRERFLKNMKLAENKADIEYEGQIMEPELDSADTKDFDESWKKFNLSSPPMNTSKQTTDELDQIIKLTSNLTNDEREEIAAQDVNDLENLFFDILDQHDVKYKKSLYNKIKKIVEQLSTIGMYFKKRYNRARPKQLLSKEHAKQIKGGKTALSASYPSTHALVGVVLAGIFKKLYPDLSFEFEKLGTSLGYNRIKAGYHYKSDYEAGVKLGRYLLKINLDNILSSVMGTISEAVVGKSQEEMDEIGRTIWNTARKYRGKANAIVDFEREINAALQPYRIMFDQNNSDLRRLGLPGKVERVGDGVIAVIRTPPIGQLIQHFQHYMMLLSHELVHVDQLNRAEARVPGSIDTMYRNYEKRVMKDGKIDREAYARDRHELMAYARSTVDMLIAKGFTKKEILERLRRGEHINEPMPAINASDKRRKLKYAIAYAEQLPTT